MFEFIAYSTSSPTCLVSTTRRGKWTVGSNVGRKGHNSYEIKFKGKTYQSSRIIWEMFNGPVPEGMLVCYKDGNSFNPRIENLVLRSATQRAIHSSVHKDKVNGLPRGVTQTNNGRFSAKTRWPKSLGGKWVHLGVFDTVEEAEAAYQSSLKMKMKVEC